MRKREIANLLQQENEQLARIKVEDVIREEQTLSCFEILAPMLQQVEARASLIAQEDICPSQLREAVASTIYASARLDDISDLNIVREQLKLKFGDKFYDEQKNNTHKEVNYRIAKILDHGLPSGPLALKNLRKIAEEFEVAWMPRDYSLFTPDPQPQIDNESNTNQQNTGVYPSIPTTSQVDQNFVQSNQIYPSTNDFSAPPPPAPFKTDESMYPSISTNVDYNPPPTTTVPTQSSSNLNDNLQQSHSSESESISELQRRYQNLKSSTSMTQSSSVDSPLTSMTQSNEETDHMRVIGKAHAVFEFSSNHPDELSIEPHEELDVIHDPSEVKETEWILCRNSRNLMGYVPLNHLKVEMFDDN